MTVAEIAERIGVTRQQIGYDLREIRKRWIDAQIVDFNEAKAAELVRLDAIIYRAEGFLAKSCLEPASVKKQWADVLLKCVDQRCKILGLYAPTKVEPPVPVNEFRDIIDELTPDERIALHRVLTRPSNAMQSSDSTSAKDVSPTEALDAYHQAIEDLPGERRSGLWQGEQDAIENINMGIQGAEADGHVADLVEYQQAVRLMPA
jgi:hypothetical protein